jgi:hypothetical protein
MDAQIGYDLAGQFDFLRGNEGEQKEGVLARDLKFSEIDQPQLYYQGRDQKDDQPFDEPGQTGEAELGCVLHHIALIARFFICNPATWPTFYQEPNRPKESM